MNSKVITAEQAALLVKNGDTVGTVGFVGGGHAEEISIAIEKRFLETGEPNNLTLTFGASQSDSKTNVGLNRYCKEGMTKRVIAGHLNLQVDLADLINQNKVEAYNFPQGVMMHLYRAIGGKKPGVISHIGLQTFVDPRESGGKLNQRTTEDLVEVVNLGGSEFLWYRSFPINVALIRGTYADEKGNLTWNKEGARLEHLAMALAARASGGIVIAQVEAIGQAGTFDPRNIIVPGVLIDYLVIASPENHMQSYAAYYEPWLSGDVKLPLKNVAPIPLDERKVVSRRAAMELVPDAVINLGIGMPESVAAVAAEEGIVDLTTSTVEPGPIGGVPQSGVRFGTAINPEAFMDHPSQFDFYDGGGLDLAVLGLAELDEQGNVNVSKFGPRIAGAGGFINISQSSKKVVFIGSFTAGGFKCQVADGKLNIIQDGKIHKLIKAVEQKTFSGEFARTRGLDVLFVTERAVFAIRPEGLTLIEIAPGVDLEKHILAKMDFTPKIAKDLKLMDVRIFTDQPMDIRDEILSKRN